jgi:hypothetical protein
MGGPSLIDRVLSWSSYLTAEEKLHYEVINVDFIMMDYYWTPEFRPFVEGLVKNAPSLIFLVGLQGTGKTSALKAIEAYMSGKVGAYYWRWGDKSPEDWEHIKHCGFLLVDLPDYGAGAGSKMAKDLDGIGRLWYDLRYGEKYKRKNLVVAVQKELFKNHYLFGKGEVFELRPLRPEELINFYWRRFGAGIPFEGDSLPLVARLSRGVFRRFMRYVRLCVMDMQARKVESIIVDDVRRVIGSDVIMRDMDLELSGLLRGSEKGLAVAAISALMMEGEMNQKDLASRLGVTQTMISRLLGKLDCLGYVKREHGDRKELRVSLRDVSQQIGVFE